VAGLLLEGASFLPATLGASVGPGFVAVLVSVVSLTVQMAVLEELEQEGAALQRFGCRIGWLFHLPSSK